MGKIVIMLSFLTLLLKADIHTTCLSCHEKNQIPSELIYKRYILKYSTKTYIKEAIVSYLKNPTKKSSIMPSAFFTKFPMKIKVHIDDKSLEQNVLEYIEKFDIQKKLIL